MPHITRRFEWDSGHRVLNHEGRCRHLHGHRYAAEVTVWSAGLDALGRVIDFGEVKRIVGGWIDENWDHNILFHPQDPVLRVVEEAKNFDDPEEVVYAGRSPYIMPDGNPTAENMVKILFLVCSKLLPDGLTVVRVKLYETPNCWAEYPGE